MTDEVVFECDRPGCSYLAVGRTRKQAEARLTSHWGAKDHRAFIEAILAADRSE